jgi:hypothetical protein
VLKRKYLPLLGYKPWSSSPSQMSVICGSSYIMSTPFNIVTKHVDELEEPATQILSIPDLRSTVSFMFSCFTCIKQFLVFTE